jgi:small subunit ribosomal protein S3
MGQKVNPKGFRLIIRKNWSSRWFAKNDADFQKFVLEDIKIRQIIQKKFANMRAMIADVLINRYAKSIEIVIQTARPGVIIGKNGDIIEALKKDLQKNLEAPLNINIEEVRNPELNAKITADAVVQQIERRVAFRKAMKRALQTSMKFGALGVKIEVSGRLNGIEIARSEWYREGSIPLHTISADIDYAISEAHTTYGIIGVKVWIYKGAIQPRNYSSKKNDNTKFSAAPADERKKVARKRGSKNVAAK